MKNILIKKFLAMREASAIQLKNKKEAIGVRPYKLDPNNKDIQLNPLLKSATKEELKDDGFEHRSSEETTDPLQDID